MHHTCVFCQENLTAAKARAVRCAADTPIDDDSDCTSLGDNEKSDDGREGATQTLASRYITPKLKHPKKQ